MTQRPINRRPDPVTAAVNDRGLRWHFCRARLWKSSVFGVPISACIIDAPLARWAGPSDHQPARPGRAVRSDRKGGLIRNAAAHHRQIEALGRHQPAVDAGYLLGGGQQFGRAGGAECGLRLGLNAVGVEVHQLLRIESVHARPTAGWAACRRRRPTRAAPFSKSVGENAASSFCTRTLAERLGAGSQSASSHPSPPLVAPLCAAQVQARTASQSEIERPWNLHIIIGLTSNSTSYDGLPGIIESKRITTEQIRWRAKCGGRSKDCHRTREPITCPRIVEELYLCG